MTKKQKIILALASPIMIWCLVMMTIFLVKQSNPEAVAKEAFATLNEYRSSHDLIWDDELAELAKQHSEWMNENQLLEHSDMDYYECIEFSPGGYAYDTNVLSPWMGSLPHSKIIFSEDIYYAAIGIDGDYATFLAR